MDLRTDNFTEKLSALQTLIGEPTMTDVIKRVGGKDIVIFLGNTKSGKSTLVNCIAGVNLKAVRVTKKVFKIIKEEDNDNERGPKIGSSSVSETTIPSVWSSTQIEELIVDSPGFGDNRGEAQDTANAYYIRELIKSSKSVKILLICSISDIANDNIAAFINFIDYLHTMFGSYVGASNNKLPLFKAMAVVFTKDRDRTTPEDIVEYFNEKILHNDEIVTTNRDLIQFFVDHKEHIGLFGMPENEGDINKNTYQTIIEIIKNQTEKIEEETLSSLKLGLSDKTKQFLFEARTHFVELKDLDDFLSIVNTNFEIYLENLETRETSNKMTKLVQIKNELSNIIKSIEGKSSFSQIDLNNIIKIMNDLTNVIIVSNQEIDKIKNKMKFGEFVDNILEMEDSRIPLYKVNGTLSKIINKSNEIFIKLQKKEFNISAQEADNKLKELELMKVQQEQTLKEEIDRMIQSNNKSINENKLKNSSPIYTENKPFTLPTDNSPNNDKSLRKELIGKPNAPSVVPKLIYKIIKEPNYFPQISDQNKKTLEELNSSIDKIHQGAIIKEITDKDIIIFLGNTKSGKSTLLNFILHGQLKKEQYFKGSRKYFRLVKEDEKSKGPTIGHTSVSETTVPSIWKIPESNQILIDTPGFDNNRGESQDIFNSYFLDMIIKMSRTVKFIVISDSREILGDNIQPFISLFDRIACIFRDVNHEAYDGIGLVFNKVPDGHTKSSLLNIIKQELLENQIIIMKNKSILGHFYNDRKECVGIFKIPKEESIVSNVDTDYNSIFDVIKKSTTLPTNMFENVTPCVSDRAKVFLLKIYKEFGNEPNLALFVESLQSNFTNLLIKLERESSKEELLTKISQLISNIKTIRDNGLNFLKKLTEITKIDKNLVPTTLDQKVSERYYILHYVDSVLDIRQSSLFDMELERTLFKIQLDMEKKLIDIEHRQGLSDFQDFKRNQDENELKSKRMQNILEEKAENIIKQNKQTVQYQTQKSYIIKNINQLHKIALLLISKSEIAKWITHYDKKTDKSQIHLTPH